MSQMEMNERDLLIRLDEKINMIIDQLGVYSSRVSTIEAKMSKVENYQQPCVDFKLFKEQFDKTVQSNERIKLWLIGLSISSFISISGIVIGAAIRFLK